MVEIDTVFQTKTGKKTIPFGAAHTYIAYIRDYPPGAKNALQIMSLAVYASETNKPREQSWLGFLDLDKLPRNRYKIHWQVVQIKHFTAHFYG